MSEQQLYNKFYKKWQEVTELPTQQVGPLTPLYKMTIPYFKTAPWRILIPAAVILVSAAFFMHELTSSQIASILQRGF